MTIEMATEQVIECGSYFSFLWQKTWQILKGGDWFWHTTSGVSFHGQLDGHRPGIRQAIMAVGACARRAAYLMVARKLEDKKGSGTNDILQKHAPQCLPQKAPCPSFYYFPITTSNHESSMN